MITTVMIRHIKPRKMARQKLNLVIRKEYGHYYLLTILHGVQKQVAYVYGTWVIVDILLKRADTIALLNIAVGFISIFFLDRIGRWIDKFGIKRMMYTEALIFIGVYTIYGMVVWGITSKVLPGQGLSVFIVYLLFILDRLSMQMGMIRAVYLRSIAFSEEEVISTLSMGVSLDHIIAILAAIAGGFIWSKWGSQWVFFLAAVFSLGNLYVAYQVEDKEEDSLPDINEISQ